MAVNSFFIYDFDQYTVTLNGIIFEGWGEGTALTITPETDSFNDYAGIDGSVVRTKSMDNRWTATCSLLQTSPTNIALAALLEVDKSTPNGAGVGVFMVKNLQGLETFIGAQAWIKRAPDITLENKPTVRNWIIRVAHGVLTL